MEDMRIEFLYNSENESQLTLDYLNKLLTYMEKPEEWEFFKEGKNEDT